MVYGTCNELVTGVNLNQRSHHWGASHCTNPPCFPLESWNCPLPCYQVGSINMTFHPIAKQQLLQWRISWEFHGFEWDLPSGKHLHSY